MTTFDGGKKIGELIRIEWDKETGDVCIVINITDTNFKKRILHNRDFQDMLKIEGKDAVIVAGHKNRDQEE